MADLPTRSVTFDCAPAARANAIATVEVDRTSKDGVFFGGGVFFFGCSEQVDSVEKPRDCYAVNDKLISMDGGGTRPRVGRIVAIHATLEEATDAWTRRGTARDRREEGLHSMTKSGNYIMVDALTSGGFRRRLIPLREGETVPSDPGVPGMRLETDDEFRARIIAQLGEPTARNE